MKKPLADQVIVVTGASSGLGRAIAPAGGRARREGRRHRPHRRGARHVRARDRGRPARRRSPSPPTAPCRTRSSRWSSRRSTASAGSTSYVANAIVTVYAETYRLRARRAAPDHGRELLRRRSTATGPRCRTCATSRGTFVSRQLGARLPRHPAAGGVLLVEGRACARSSSRRGSRSRRQAGTSRSRSSSRARSTRRSSTATARRSASSRSRCRRSTSRSRSRTRCSTAASTRSASCRSPGARRSCSGARSSRPRAGDWMLRRIGWKSQHTGEPKPLDAPDNLFETAAGRPGRARSLRRRRAARRPGRRCGSAALAAGGARLLGVAWWPQDPLSCWLARSAPEVLR